MATSYATERATLSSPPLPRVLVAAAAGVVLFFAVLFTFGIGYNLAYSGMVFPGVSVAGVDLSGKTPGEATALLSNKLSYPETGKIVFKDGDSVWVATPADLGLYFDAQNSAMAAYSIGRMGDPLSRFYDQFLAGYNGLELAPQLIFDKIYAQRTLEEIAAEMHRPTIEAALDINGSQVVAVPGQIGHSLDIGATMAPLEEHLRNRNDALLILEVVETPPEILDASEQAEAAQQILSEALILQVPEAELGDPGPWTFSPEAIAEMLTIERVQDGNGARFQVGLNAEDMRPFLDELAPRLARNPSNARFIFNDDTRQLEVIQPAVIGRYLDVDETIRSVNQRLGEGEHNLPLHIVHNQPAVNDQATADSLGITELVSVHTSYFRGSSAARIQNIETASSRFHGVLVPPWSTFSMAEVMGDVSLDTGYEEALIIFGGRTIKGVGGGVCQVSTTLFRTVFFGGYPVEERHPHAYRVGYYEQTGNSWDDNLAGLDATVFVPMVDFKFTNNSDNWLLMETYVNPGGRTLTWKFYSTSDGRTVEWDSSGPQNVEEPPKPLYEENPELAKGEIKQVDWAADGADVSITRVIYINGEVLFEDSFNTHYMPWRAVYQYGPGTKIPEKFRNQD